MTRAGELPLAVEMRPHDESPGVAPRAQSFALAYSCAVAYDRAMTTVVVTLENGRTETGTEVSRTSGRGPSSVLVRWQDRTECWVPSWRVRSL